MKKENRELLRIQNLIESDRLNVGSNFEELFASDLKKLLEDYFEIDQVPTIKTEKIKKTYKVLIDFNIKSIKIVNFLPR